MVDRKSTRLNSSHSQMSYAVFFFNDTATTEIYTLSLHDALPISVCASTTSLQWRSGTSALTGLMPFAANGGISVPFSPVGLFQATSGSSLVLFNESASSVGGSIVYLRSTSI